MFKFENERLLRVGHNSKYYAEFLPMGLLGKAFWIFKFENTIPEAVTFFNTYGVQYRWRLHLP